MADISNDPTQVERFDHREVDKKWQVEWAEQQTYQTPKASDTRPRAYILDMFPYPSGEGLHVGHPLGYIGTDIVARYQRAKGKAVLHPMGWDAFGLPAENYAIKTGTHPAETTTTAINRFRKQLQLIGLSYDWDRELNTSDPTYYKWTQWLFLKLYEHGLAYRAKAAVNWCASCQTVLANEQVKNGRCDRCDHEVTQKELEQWFFKITNYADELLKEIKELDWPEPIKLMQKNWIGKKEGVLIDHRVVGSDIVLTSFSAYPAWLFADTFLVIAPEHDLVPLLVADSEQAAAVHEFVRASREISHEDRLADRFEKRGIFTGRYVTDPFTGLEMPVWIANFALVDFGTGIIRCSAHDPRDYAFANKYQIPLREVVERVHESEPVNAHENTGLLKDSGAFSGQRIDSKLIKDMLDWMEEEKIGRRHTTYKLRDWLVSRQRYWGAPIPIIYCRNCSEEAENSDQKIAITTIDGERYAMWPVPGNQLPVLLPQDVDFKPTGHSPLVDSKEFNQGVICPHCGQPARREVDTMDTFVDSSWYFLRFADPHNQSAAFDPEKVREWLPVDWYVGGAEHAVLHLLYARFFTKFLADIKLVDFREPFTCLKNQGLIMGEDNRKMSKRWGNVINPDDVIEQYGADALRCFEMFMGPFNDSKPWKTNGLIGVRRWLERVWRLRTKDKLTRDTSLEKSQLDRLVQQSIAKITEDIEDFQFNTVVSQLMILTNAFEKHPSITDGHWQIFLRLLAPFGPHIAHELWVLASYSGAVDDDWPILTTTGNQDELVTIPVQVNGRLRGQLRISKKTAEDELVRQAKELPTVEDYLKNTTLKKTIIVPGRIVNFVVK